PSSAAPARSPACAAAFFPGRAWVPGRRSTVAALEVLPSPPSLLVVPRPAAPTPRRRPRRPGPRRRVPRRPRPARAAAHLGVLARSVEPPVESSAPSRPPGCPHAAPAPTTPPLLPPRPGTSYSFLP